MPENLSETGARLGEQVGSAAERARGAVAQAANTAKEYGTQGYKYAAEQTRRAKQTTESYIQQNPWYAVGMAVGVGVLVGMLLRWRRSED